MCNVLLAGRSLTAWSRAWRCCLHSAPGRSSRQKMERYFLFPNTFNLSQYLSLHFYDYIQYFIFKFLPNKAQEKDWDKCTFLLSLTVKVYYHKNDTVYSDNMYSVWLFRCTTTTTQYTLYNIYYVWLFRCTTTTTTPRSRSGSPPGNSRISR